MEDKEENKKNESEKKSRYKCQPELQIYDEFGHESSDDYMKALEEHKLKMKKKRE